MGSAPSAGSATVSATLVAVVALDRPQAPGQVLAALVGELRAWCRQGHRRAERHARLERRRQQDAGLRVGLLVVDGVGDRDLSWLFCTSDAVK